MCFALTNLVPESRPRASWPRRRPDRRGIMLIFMAFLLVFVLAMVAFAVDLGYLLVTRTELQRTADATALAAVWDLMDEGALSTDASVSTTMDNVRSTVAAYAVMNGLPNVDANATNDPAGDIVVGTIATLGDSMTFDTPSTYNAVRVRVRRDGTINTAVPTFFAHALGFNTVSAQAEATARFENRVGGFRDPGDGSNLPILPLALDANAWHDLSHGTTPDEWSWDSENGVATAAPDGTHEVNLFPQDTDSPGNFGMIDIGSSSNSTSDAVTMILDGATSTDMDYHGGILGLDANGELVLGGDPGLSSGIKDALTQIVGQTRIVGLYSTVTDSGGNAQYTVVKFVAVRVLQVDFSNSMKTKQLIVQPSTIVTKWAIPGDGSGTTSDFIYSLPTLVY